MTSTDDALLGTQYSVFPAAAMPADFVCSRASRRGPWPSRRDPSGGGGGGEGGGRGGGRGGVEAAESRAVATSLLKERSLWRVKLGRG
jgi:hypothetical protein